MPSRDPLDPATPVRDASAEDIVADRTTLLEIGMGAVFVACCVFAALRFVAHLVTGLATPWLGNAIGAVAVALLFAGTAAPRTAARPSSSTERRSWRPSPCSSRRPTG